MLAEEEGWAVREKLLLVEAVPKGSGNWAAVSRIIRQHIPEGRNPLLFGSRVRYVSS